MNSDKPINLCYFNSLYSLISSVTTFHPPVSPTFQSEAEVKAAKARLQQEQAQSKCAPEPTPLTTPSPSTSQHEDLASQQERRAPISEGDFPADPPQSPDLRHRQTATQREEPVAQVHVREGALAAEPVGGTVSYVIMWLLIVAIAGLLLRRLLYS